LFQFRYFSLKLSGTGFVHRESMPWEEKGVKVNGYWTCSRTRLVLPSPARNPQGFNAPHFAFFKRLLFKNFSF
jgi:hypothetical protein